jgi:amidase
MDFEEFTTYDAVALAELVRRKQVHPQELASIALKAAREQKPVLNATTVIFDQEVEEQLASLDVHDSNCVLPGVPMMIKDIGIFFENTDNFNGGGEFLRTKASFNSTITERYRRAGLTICGKTTTPELALNVVTESRAFGPTRNPHDLERGVGGSSGGSGAVVAAGIVPVAHGSDNGGSIRIPASSCGVYGLKPSRGLVPVGPHVGIARDVSESWSLTNCNHVLTRTVRDSALLLDIETGLHPDAETSYSKCLEQRPGKLKVGLLTQSPIGTPVARECLDALRASAERLDDLGWSVIPARFQIDGDMMLWALRVVAGASLWHALEARAKHFGRPRAIGDVETITALWAEEGRKHTAAQYVEAVEVLGNIARSFDAFISGFDIVMTPALAEPPLPIGSCSQMGDDIDGYLLSVYGNVPFLPIFNSSGGAAASLPIAETADGLPIGIHLGGKLGQDKLILQVSALLERELKFTPVANRWRSSGVRTAVPKIDASGGRALHTDIG